jgi:hypothetical protein
MRRLQGKRHYRAGYVNDEQIERVFVLIEFAMTDYANSPEANRALSEMDQQAYLASSK